MTQHYLSATEAAQYLGITRGAFMSLKLPEPDAYVGKARGWLPETIDQWNANRPGRGVGGGRPRKNAA